MWLTKIWAIAPRSRLISTPWLTARVSLSAVCNMASDTQIFVFSPIYTRPKVVIDFASKGTVHKHLLREAWWNKGPLKFLTLVRRGGLEKKNQKFSSENWVLTFFLCGWPIIFISERLPEIFWGLKGSPKLFIIVNKRRYQVRVYKAWSGIFYSAHPSYFQPLL